MTGRCSSHLFAPIFPGNSIKINYFVFAVLIYLIYNFGNATSPETFSIFMTTSRCFILLHLTSEFSIMASSRFSHNVGFSSLLSWNTCIHSTFSTLSFHICLSHLFAENISITSFSLFIES